MNRPRRRASGGPRPRPAPRALPQGQNPVDPFSCAVIPLGTPLPPTVALLLAAALAPFASAHAYHHGCGESDAGTDHAPGSKYGAVYVWTGEDCVGAAGTVDRDCGIHWEHAPGVHVHIVEGEGCVTMVLLDCRPEWLAEPLCIDLP